MTGSTAARLAAASRCVAGIVDDLRRQEKTGTRPHAKRLTTQCCRRFRTRNAGTAEAGTAASSCVKAAKREAELTAMPLRLDAGGQDAEDR